MEQITWTEDYSVGVARFDEQHKRLIQMINRLIVQPQTTTTSETVSDLLTDMTKYAKKHFAEEEELMRQYNYPRLKEHVAQHRTFQKKTVDFCSDTMLNLGNVPENLFNYLSEWLIEHILKRDMAYKLCFREKGIK